MLHAVGFNKVVLQRINLPLHRYDHLRRRFLKIGFSRSNLGVHLLYAGPLVGVGLTQSFPLLFEITQLLTKFSDQLVALHRRVSKWIVGFFSGCIVGLCRTQRVFGLEQLSAVGLFSLGCEICRRGRQGQVVILGEVKPCIALGLYLFLRLGNLFRQISFCQSGVVPS